MFDERDISYQIVSRVQIRYIEVSPRIFSDVRKEGKAGAEHTTLNILDLDYVGKSSWSLDASPTMWERRHARRQVNRKLFEKKTCQGCNSRVQSVLASATVLEKKEN